tara:strand:+ start:36 stop:209 length:174 start_codon:yes stop_codon:yes gene_type:complete
MKVKLKKGERLSSNHNYCNLDYDDWVSLNQGKSVELSSVPSLVEDKLESNKESKGGK